MYLSRNPLRCSLQMVSYHSYTCKSQYVFPWYNPRKLHVILYFREIHVLLTVCSEFQRHFGAEGYISLLRCLDKNLSCTPLSSLP